MRYLLDTHTFLWFLEGNELLPIEVKKVITNPDNKCLLSIASLWEIAIKLRIKKLSLQFPFSKMIDYLIELDIDLLPLNFEHVISLMDVDLHHRDPFDHILIAQAMAEDMTIITKDANFPLYKVKIMWT